MKTAPFHGDRRIGAAWIGCRRDGADNGPFLFGGNLLLRELIQQPDGSLGTAFVPEAIPAGSACECLPEAVLGDVRPKGKGVRLANGEGLAVARCPEIPGDARITVRVRPWARTGSFGLRLCAEGKFESGYELVFLPAERTVRLAGQALTLVDGLDGEFFLDVVLKGELVDICVAGCRTLVDRFPQRRGRALLFFAQNSDVEFADLAIEDLS
jgi:hypothetical protein